MFFFKFLTGLCVRAKQNNHPFQYSQIMVEITAAARKYELRVCSTALSRTTP